MKVAIFENEFIFVEASFKAFNTIYCNNKLQYTVFVSSQSFGDLANLENYDMMIVDIDLSIMSQMDGYQLIETVEQSQIKKPSIIILTGHKAVNEQLKSRGLASYPIIAKPVNLTKIKEAFDHYKIDLT